MQRRDDEGHAPFGADGQVALPARIAGMDDQVHAIRRDARVGVGLALGGQAFLDAADPLVQLFLRTGVQRGERADDPRRALRHDQRRPRDQEHGGADDRQAGLGL
ncbi:hypothetical protein G6F57_023578 [Rhizopus arrhizus]|nr:hypothetical protein G6F57_023578 [Rhizopus arrhizus]